MLKKYEVRVKTQGKGGISRKYVSHIGELYVLLKEAAPKDVLGVYKLKFINGDVVGSDTLDWKLKGNNLSLKTRIVKKKKSCPPDTPFPPQQEKEEPGVSEVKLPPGVKRPQARHVSAAGPRQVKRENVIRSPQVRRESVVKPPQVRREGIVRPPQTRQASITRPSQVRHIKMAGQPPPPRVAVRQEKGVVSGVRNPKSKATPRVPRTAPNLTTRARRIKRG